MDQDRYCFSLSVSLRNGPEFQSRVPAALSASYYLNFSGSLPMVWGVLCSRGRLRWICVSFAFKGMLAFEVISRECLKHCMNPHQNMENLLRR